MNRANPIRLSLKGIRKRFGGVDALNDVDLEVAAGEFFTLLGPSGCGKTTLLRIVAGLEFPDGGQVFLGAEEITRLPAAKRPVNTVFQSYALFPHLDVYENVAFGLRARRIGGAEVKTRVESHLALLGLEEKSARLPHQLSGGEKQRVALARALVNEPQVLLLDEPLSALDARLRARLQEELRRLQRALGQTFILVTHDQSEALAVSDRIAVMDRGALVQCGRPQEVYERPRNRYVAEFLGAANLIRGRTVDGGLECDLGLLRLQATPGWSQGWIAIRPEHIRILGQAPPSNGFCVRVREAVYRGSGTELWVEPGPLRVQTSSVNGFAPGSALWLELPAEHLVLLEGE